MIRNVLLTGMLTGMLTGCASGSVAVTEEAVGVESELDTGGVDAAEGPAETERIGSGTWLLQSASVDEDPCGFVSYVNDNFNQYTFEFFLPRTFTVAGDEGSFTIIADQYGARNPVWCSLEGGEFSCDIQTARPFGVEDDSWEYQIKFSGAVVDSETIRGEVLVSYPGLGGYEDEIADAGVDIVDCSNLITLELSYGTF